MLEAYRQHVEERAAEGVPPKPLNSEQTAALVELLKNPPAGEEQVGQGGARDDVRRRVRPAREAPAHAVTGVG